MYANAVKPVEIPTEGGKTRILKNGYVYWITQSSWNNEKKRTDDNRVCIGKLVPDMAGWIYPNDRFQKIFNTSPDTQQNSFATKSKRGKFHTHLNFGVFYILKQSSILSGCYEALIRTFPKNIVDRIFSVAMHAIDARNSVAQDFLGWSFDNYCGLSKSLADTEISSLYKFLASSPESLEAFQKNFREIYHNFFPSADRHALAYDSTNQNTNSKNIGLAEFGHAKVNKNLPIINTVFFVDQATGIPLYYEHFCGSLLDKTQNQLTLKKAQALGFQHLFLMMDRGYMTKENLNILRKEKFAVMCPDGLLFTKDLIEKYRIEIKDCEKYYIAAEDVYGIHLPETIYDGSMYDAYVFYDAKRAHEERNSIHSRINFLKSDILKKKRYSEKLKEKSKPWIIIEKSSNTDEDGRNFTISVNTDEVQKCLDDAGYFVILSNANLDAEKMIRTARMRDKGEKAFRRLKSHFGLDTTYSHSEETFEGKMFVAHVALIIVESFRYFIKDLLKSKTSETTNTVLSEMRKYKIKMIKPGEWIPIYAVTAKQKSILKGIASSAEELESAASNVWLRV